MIKMHKESVRVARSDPSTEARLATLRNVFTGITDTVAAQAERQGVEAARAASKARAVQVRESHARAEQATEEGRRAPDRAYFFRPYGHLDKSLWEEQELRAWFSGNAATGSLAGPSFEGAPLGASLRDSGYTMDASRALPRGRPNPYAHSAPTVARPEDALNTSRTLAAQAWRASGSSIHWSDREALLPLERATARQALDATGFDPGLTQRAQPFKSRPAEDDAWRFKPPHPVAHKLDMVQKHTEAAAGGVHNFERSRAASQRALGTERSNFF
jgi:hypothetical protein